MIRAVVRWIVAPIAGALMFVTGSAVFAELPTAGAIPPPGRTAELTLTVQDDPTSDAMTTTDEATSATHLSLGVFARDLESEALSLSEDGTRLLTTTIGPGTAGQLVLAQLAADRFGIVDNPFFDPMRVAVVRDGEALAALSTGVILGHPIGSPQFGTTEVIPMDLLEGLRARAGWSISAAREAEAQKYAGLLDGYVPAFLRSDEVYGLYLERARSNYATLAAAA